MDLEIETKSQILRVREAFSDYENTGRDFRKGGGDAPKSSIKSTDILAALSSASTTSVTSSTSTTSSDLLNLDVPFSRVASSLSSETIDFDLFVKQKS